MIENYNFVDASISFSCEILNYIWELQKREVHPSSVQIHQFFNKTKSYTEKPILLLKTLNIIFENEGKQFVIENNIAKSLNGNNDRAKLVIKERIIHLKPFIEYNYFLTVGKKKEEAAKIIKQVYNLNEQSSFLIKLFEKWNKTFDILFEPANVGINDNIEFESNIKEEIQILSRLKNILGGNYQYISQLVLDDLVLASKEINGNPRKSINDAGRALEDFLRIDFADNIDLKKCNGIGQIANQLSNSTSSTSKHNGIILALGQIRTMGDAHGVDKIHAERWQIRESSAANYLHSVICIMNSLLEYKHNGVLLY